MSLIFSNKNLVYVTIIVSLFMFIFEYCQNSDNETFAQTNPTIISTRGSFDLTNGNSIQQVNLPSVHSLIDSNNCPGELSVYVHGVWASEFQAEEQTQRVYLSLLKNGQTIPVIGFSWHSNTVKNPSGWNIAKIIANKNGPDLAKFILDFKN